MDLQEGVQDVGPLHRQEGERRGEVGLLGHERTMSMRRGE